MIKLNYPDFWQKRNWLSYLMLPFAALYSFAAKVRYLSIPTIRLPGKVICVGNITVGGTGKTQLIIKLAKEFKKKKIKFVIVSKGYGGSFKKPMMVNEDMDPQIVGDEALELCAYGPTVISRKATDAAALLKELEPEIILVDDGAQNPSFFKDVTIVTIDGIRGFGNKFPIPAGPMREPDIMHEIDAIVIITNEEYIESLEADKFITSAFIKQSNTLNKDRKYYAFAGIGNNDRFFTQLQNDGFNIVKTKKFPDHYFYKDEDIAQLEQEAGAMLAYLITTAKDYVKIHNKENISCYNVELRIRDEEKLMELIYAKLY